jgi:hypothetical protein
MIKDLKGSEAIRVGGFIRSLEWLARRCILNVQASVKLVENAYMLPCTREREHTEYQIF